MSFIICEKYFLLLLICFQIILCISPYNFLLLLVASEATLLYFTLSHNLFQVYLVTLICMEAILYLTKDCPSS